MSTAFLTSFFSIFLLSHAYEKHSLDWPTEISSGQNKIGPILHQFQKFGDSYFHEGVDILTPEGQIVFSPATGQVDAGYYAYETLPNGLSEKTYISIRDIDENDKEPKLWGELYFEVSVVDKNGFRFEMHHISRESLNTELISSIQSSGKILAGTPIGSIVPWPTEVHGVQYNHIHYSILDPNGLYRNPFWYSELIDDDTAPKIINLYASLSQRCPANGLRQLKELSQIKDSDNVTHLVVQTEDLMGDNFFPHVSTTMTAIFDDGSSFGFDYSQSLFTDELNSYPLHDLYVGRFCIGAENFPFCNPRL